MRGWRGNSLYLLVFTVWSLKKKYWGVRRKCVEAFSKKENIRVRTICNALGGSELIIQVFDSWGSSMRSLLETWTLSDFLIGIRTFCKCSQWLVCTLMFEKYELSLGLCTGALELLSFSPFPPTTHLLIPILPHCRVAKRTKAHIICEYFFFRARKAKAEAF